MQMVLINAVYGDYYSHTLSKIIYTGLANK